MKIDVNTLSQEAVAAARAASVHTGGQGGGGAKPQGTAGTDRVELSPDVEVMTAALKAAQEAPEIRADKVERARALLESGELGSDTGKLANRIIDHLLTR